MRFGYDVTFTGVGTAQNALNMCPEQLDQFPSFAELGFCTQIAIFSRFNPRKIAPTHPLPWGTLHMIADLQYPRNVLTPYPPNPNDIATSLGKMGEFFFPEFDSDGTFNFEPSPMASSLGRIYCESEDFVVYQVPIQKLWDCFYSLQKLCRFNKDVFLNASKVLHGRKFDRGIP